MASSTEGHDPAKRGGLLADTRGLPWHSLGEGIAFQLLRYCDVTGQWALYVRMAPGSRILTHRHLSSGEFFVTRGELIYDAGSAPAGVYGYEALGEVHSEARAEVETEYLFLGHGAVAFTGEDDKIDFILDAAFLKNLAEGQHMQSVTANTG